MPTRPRSRCPRCRRPLDAKGRCTAQCRTRRRAASQRSRGSSTAQGYGGEHRTRFRPAVLARDPVCVICGVEPSVVADHWPLDRKELVARGEDPNDPRHGRGLCRSCDSSQTARRQPGGWNRR
ncbi:holin [Streptomyces sp. DH37]|uniref:holin n=1 Tax=Streptomyces sp. DH37 TaxID=3040122 RepID=UPI002441161B|nr:holin [Streptomyces sp. DH37]MDG9703794.1 holin [Streptomyces sp. DH37]